MASIFTKIVNGEIPCYKVAENESFLAFLDIAPLAAGHTLVIPKKEVDYIFDLDDVLFLELHLFSKKVARALHSATNCKRVGVAVIGLEVPHAHIHLVPLMHQHDVIDFSRTKLQLTSREFEAIAGKITAEVES